MRTGNRTSMKVRLELLVSRSVQQMARKLHAGRRLTAGIVALAGTLAATHTVMADVTKVYWTDRDNGTLSETDVSSGATQVLVQNFSRLQDVDLDTSTGTLYFADWGPIGVGNGGSINRVNRDGTGLATVLNTRDAVHQLALDQALQRIYFTRAVSYNDHEISHVDTSGANYTILLQGDGSGPGWFPSGLALDSGNNTLYWGDIGIIFNPPNGSVNEMGTDGSAPTQLTPHVDGRGRGFAFDQASQTIFFTAHDPISPATGGGIFSYDIANNIETQLISDVDTGYWDIEIDASGQRIWWTDYGRGEIRSARFDGTDVQVELSGLTNPYGLALEETCELGTVCDEHICKSVAYRTKDGDCLIEVGEKVYFETTFDVTNYSSAFWTNTRVRDCFFRDVTVTDFHTQSGEVDWFMAGNNKTCLNWDIGKLAPGESATLAIDLTTGLDRKGRQEYRSCSNHTFNNGALLLFNAPHKHYFRTGRLVVSVLTPDAEGDCDGDGFSDQEELDAGTDPHDPTDFPCPQFDRIIDADGTASAGDGIPGAVSVVCGDLLASFPVTGATTAGVDWFDNDHDGQWTFGLGGDDLHSEDPGTCPTAIRDGVHQLGQDCKILDLNSSLFTGQQVDCDLEVNFPFTEPHLSNGGCPSSINNIRYHDADGDGSWDDGEDIVLDSNGNGIFD